MEVEWEEEKWKRKIRWMQRKRKKMINRRR